MQMWFVLVFGASLVFGDPTSENLIQYEDKYPKVSSRVQIEYDTKEAIVSDEKKPKHTSHAQATLANKILGCKHISKVINNEPFNSWKASSELQTSNSPKLISNAIPSKERSKIGLYTFDDEIAGLDARRRSNLEAKIPKFYDARQIYHNCVSLHTILDEGCSCRSSWAISPASALADRYCIYYNGDINNQLSAQNILSCCDYCTENFTSGCDGGHSMWAWVYLEHTGIVTGGPYGSDEDCQNYKIQPCSVKTLKTEPPSCQKTCEVEYLQPINYKSKKSYAHDNTTVDALQRDILKNGPVTTDMEVYEDFYCYKSGIYNHLVGGLVSVQTVKIIGWGETDGTKYWLMANTWGTRWGEKGFFKIERGTNECDVESYVLAGLPSDIYKKTKHTNV